jgi:hypothetical protein
VLGALVNDWTVTGLVTLQSGIALTIAQTTTNNAFGRGPGYRNLDLALMRRIQLVGSKAIELRAEATNTAPLAAPNTTVGAAAFGTITSAGDPRVVQLAVKFVF